MARYTGPVCRLCRRAGEKLFLKGERCYMPKCAVERRRKAPGETTPRRRRVSDWAVQLREKQKARLSYGVLERQFRNYFRLARLHSGPTGGNLLQLLERRLDNIVYRVGFADSRQQARQRVRHGHFTVDGRRMDIPSYRLRPNEVVGWRESTTKGELFRVVARTAGQRPVPEWLELNRTLMEVTVLRVPEERDIDTTVDTRLVVEHYSR